MLLPPENIFRDSIEIIDEVLHSFTYLDKLDYDVSSSSVLGGENDLKTINQNVPSSCGH